jgi:hypothetical protein
MIQLGYRWMDLADIWYGRYAIGVYPKIDVDGNACVAVPVCNT